MHIRLMSLGFLIFIASTGGALASPNCTLPYTLTNGQTADASQVMANFNAVISCMGSPSIGYVNKFRNGTFDVWQRGTTPPLSVSGAYTADGWKVYYSGSAPAVIQGSGPPDGAPTLYGLAIGISTGGNTDAKIGQRIESSVVAPLAGQRVTFQIQLFNSSTAAITPQLSTCYASATDNFSSCVSDLAATNLQSCNAVTLCTLAYTFNVSPNASKGYEVDFDLGALAANAGFRVYAADIRGTPGVPTGLNSAPPAPELRPIAVELLFCQRYLYSIFPNLGQGLASESGMAFTATGVIVSIKFPTVMRAIPTFTLSAATDFAPLLVGTVGPTFTSIILGNATTTERSTLITGGTSGLSIGSAAPMIAVDTSARLTYSSEL